MRPSMLFMGRWHELVARDFDRKWHKRIGVISISPFKKIMLFHKSPNENVNETWKKSVILDFIEVKQFDVSVFYKIMKYWIQMRKNLVEEMSCLVSPSAKNIGKIFDMFIFWSTQNFLCDQFENCRKPAYF